MWPLAVFAALERSSPCAPLCHCFGALRVSVPSPEHQASDSKFPCSHHGKQGNRKDGKAIPMALDGEVSLEKGFVVKTFSLEEIAKDKGEVMKGESNRVRQSLAGKWEHGR